MRTHITHWIFAGGMIAICGCQSWSQIGQGVPAGTRVPPPATGTYNVPSSYYNNGAGAKVGTVSGTTTTPSTTGGEVRTASAQALPTTGQPAGQSPAVNSGVSTANWQVPTIDQVRSGINNSAAAALDNVSSRANQAVQSGTSKAAAAVDKYSDPLISAMQPPANPASRSLSDSFPAAPAGATTNAAPTNGTPTNNSATGAASLDATSSSRTSASTTDEPQLDWQPPQ